jgi:release factor glutamine methyltransferase
MPDWTIRALMEWTEKHFQQKQIESPRLEAQLLLAHALNCKRVELYTRWDEIVGDEGRDRFRELVKRRSEGCPAMYLIGRREFYTLEFEVTPAVLIPRPETELLVAETVKRIKELPAPRVLDIGTGSGCIAIAIAHRVKTAQVTAIDVSADALAVANRNAVKHNVAERLTFLLGDLCAPLSDDCFDAIASNPPYVAESEWAALPSHIRDHEPRLALDGGPDGFAVYDRLIPQLPRHLKPGGYALLEIGGTQDQGVRERIEAVAELEWIATILDDNKLPRVVTARRRI